MPKSKTTRVLLCALAAVIGVVAETDPVEWTKGNFTAQAEARIGRPATPLSVAGVARRSTRRVVRRTSVYVATLPAACTSVIINGASIYSCGGAYYQPYQGRYVVVVID